MKFNKLPKKAVLHVYTIALDYAESYEDYDTSQMAKDMGDRELVKKNIIPKNFVVLDMLTTLTHNKKLKNQANYIYHQQKETK